MTRVLAFHGYCELISFLEHPRYCQGLKIRVEVLCFLDMEEDVRAQPMSTYKRHAPHLSVGKMCYSERVNPNI